MIKRGNPRRLIFTSSMNLKVTKMISNCLGLGLGDRELPLLEEARAVRPPAEAAPSLAGRPARNIEYGARPSPSGSSGGGGP